MPRGRSAELQRLYDLPLDESMVLLPPDGISVATFAKRLKQVATLYLREGKAYRLQIRDDHVEATRVPVGSHKKLSYLHDLKVGERWFAGATLEWKEKKALLARLDRMAGIYGHWLAEVDHEGIWVRRWYNRTGPGYNEDRTLPEPKFLTLHRP